MCSQLEWSGVIALGRFMVVRCEVPAVCLTPVEAGLQMGWEVSGQEGSVGEWMFPRRGERGAG